MSYLEEQLNIKEGEPHYKAAMYVKEHGLSLLDFDCWTHLEALRSATMTTARPTVPLRATCWK